jgi:hypothetical protein
MDQFKISAGKLRENKGTTLKNKETWVMDQWG